MSETACLRKPDIVKTIEDSLDGEYRTAASIASICGEDNKRCMFNAQRVSRILNTHLKDKVERKKIRIKNMSRSLIYAYRRKTDAVYKEVL
jgi:hypothetical protein